MKRSPSKCPPPFSHAGFAEKSDDVLRAEAKVHLASSPHLQVMAEVLIALRVARVPWWTPEQLRARWGAERRMRWFAERPDLRQEITTALTGLVFNTARRKSPEFQAELIDSVIEDSDIGAEHFEGAFDPRDLVVYAPADELWREMIARIPWSEEPSADSILFEAILEALVAEKSALFGASRAPLLSAWDVRSAIDTRAWQACVPLAVRAAIDDARIRRERERPREAFRADDELVFATPKVLASCLALRDLKPVLDVAGTALGFDLAPTRSDVVLIAPPEGARRVG